MKTVTVHAAKTHLSKLLAEVEAGEEITIARGTKPIARLVPYRQQGRRVLGIDAHRDFWIADDFDAPLPDDLLKDFEGR